MTAGHAARDLADYASAYADLPFEAVAAAHRRRRVLASVRRTHPEKVLEVGCGRAPLFTDLPGVSVTVVEPSPVFADLARSLGAGRDDVVVVEDYAERITPQALGGPFDVAVVSSLLHEVPDPLSVLLAAARSCRVGGLVHVNVPSATSLHRRLGTALGVLEDRAAVTALGEQLQQYRVYDLQQLVELVHRAGLRVIDSGGILAKPFSHAQMQRALDAGVIDDAVLDGLDRWADLEPSLASEVWVDAEVTGA